jgi:hypothetical protein
MLKLAIVAVCNHHMGYVDKADRMATSYMATHQTWKWTKKLISTCWTWQFSTFTSFCLHVLGRKSHIENFDSPLLAWAGNEPRLSGLLLTTSADLTRATT